MKVLSLFSGVGGFDLGLERAGMETVFQCEWDKHATAILERHWPDVPRWGDITTLTGQHILNHAPVIDVVAWGSPCQDLSVAGKRAGLGGSRSGLFHEGIRIIKELQEATNGKYPRISIWENVYGALNSNKGADFGVILDEMAEAGALVQEWRVLDAQYFGVPQRRRRVFLVSVFDPATAKRCPDPLLPVSESVCRDIEAGGTERQEPAGTTTQSLGSGSDIANTISASLYHHGTVVNQDANNGHVVVEPFTGTSHAQYGAGVGTLRANGGDLAGGSETLLVEPFVKAKRAQSATDDETWVEGAVNPTINQFDQGDVRATTAIVMRQREGKPGGGKGPLLSEDKSLTLAAGSNDQTLFVTTEPLLIDGRRVDDVRVYDPPVQTLQERMGTGGNNVHVIGFSHTQGLSAQPSEAAWPTLRSEGGGQAVAYGIQGNVIGRQDHNGPGGKGHTEEGDPMFTLNTTDRHAVATTEPTVFQPGTMVRLGGGVWEGTVPIFRAEVKRGDNEPHIMTEPTMSVRRLTPLECERLMGWPDNWTEGQADTHRYKQCGNGVASPVATWIAQQLMAIPEGDA